MKNIPKITVAIPPKDSSGERDKIGEVLETKGDGMTEEERTLAANFLPQYSERDTPREDRRDCEQEVAELQNMLAAFEAEHPLGKLHAITDLTPNDAPNHPIREPARKTLIPILNRWNALKKETNISAERLAELYAAYRKLSKAVGIINNGKVRHS